MYNKSSQQTRNRRNPCWYDFKKRPKTPEASPLLTGENLNASHLRWKAKQMSALTPTQCCYRGLSWSIKTRKSRKDIPICHPAWLEIYRSQGTRKNGSLVAKLNLLVKLDLFGEEMFWGKMIKMNEDMGINIWGRKLTINYSNEKNKYNFAILQDKFTKIVILSHLCIRFLQRQALRWRKPLHHCSKMQRPGSCGPVKRDFLEQFISYLFVKPQKILRWLNGKTLLWLHVDSH